MTVTQRDMVVGAFETSPQAQRAVNELLRTGFGEDQIGVWVRTAKGEPWRPRSRRKLLRARAPLPALRQERGWGHCGDWESSRA
jgi:hypothetical protein